MLTSGGGSPHSDGGIPPLTLLGQRLNHPAAMARYFVNSSDEKGPRGVPFLIGLNGHFLETARLSLQRLAERRAYAAADGDFAGRLGKSGDSLYPARNLIGAGSPLKSLPLAGP